MSKFPLILAELRDRNGLTQAQLGESVGLSRSTISMYELGKRIPDLPTLEKFADYFNYHKNMGKFSHTLLPFTNYRGSNRILTRG